MMISVFADMLVLSWAGVFRWESTATLPEIKLNKFRPPHTTFSSSFCTVSASVNASVRLMSVSVGNHALLWTVHKPAFIKVFFILHLCDSLFHVRGRLNHLPDGDPTASFLRVPHGNVSRHQGKVPDFFILMPIDTQGCSRMIMEAHSVILFALQEGYAQSWAIGMLVITATFGEKSASGTFSHFTA